MTNRCEERDVQDRLGVLLRVGVNLAVPLAGLVVVWWSHRTRRVSDAFLGVPAHALLLAGVLACGAFTVGLRNMGFARPRLGVRQVLLLLVPCGLAFACGALFGASAGMVAVAAAVTVGAVWEESLFRGTLFHLLREVFPRDSALLLGALLFSVSHSMRILTGVPFQPLNLVVAFALGYALAVLRDRTGSVLPGILVHVVWNLASRWSVVPMGDSMLISACAALFLATWTLDHAPSSMRMRDRCAAAGAIVALWPVVIHLMAQPRIGWRTEAEDRESAARVERQVDEAVRRTVDTYFKMPARRRPALLDVLRAGKNLRPRVAALPLKLADYVRGDFNRGFGRQYTPEQRRVLAQALLAIVSARRATP